jgi:uncharacterized protein (DUF302 family)
VAARAALYHGSHLREALDAHGLQLFARIDHAAGAARPMSSWKPTSC